MTREGATTPATKALATTTTTTTTTATMATTMAMAMATTAAMAMAIGAAMATLFAAGCAEEKQAVTWDEVGPTTSSAPKLDASAKLVTQDDFDKAAAADLNATLCEQDARRMLEGDKKKGVMFMMGCMRRSDFTSLVYFQQAPWNRLHFTEGQFPLLLDVAMRRGGAEVSADFKQLGVTVTPIDEFVANDAPQDGALIEARVQMLTSGADKGGSVVTARAYGYGHTRAWVRNSNGFGSRYGDMSEVKPLGITLEVATKHASLPADRRVEIIARYNARRSEQLKAAQAREMEKYADSGIDPSKLDEKGSDPPATLAFDLVASEGSASRGKDIEMQGTTDTSNITQFRN